MKPNARPEARPLIAEAFDDYASWWYTLAGREMPPIALLGVSVLALRNVSFAALANAVAPALREMAEMAEQDMQEYFRDFAAPDEVYTFSAWLASFEFDPFAPRQLAI